MATRIFFEPINFTQGDGVVINPNGTDIFLNSSQTVTIGIEQNMGEMAADHKMGAHYYKGKCVTTRWASTKMHGKAWKWDE